MNGYQLEQIRRIQALNERIYAPQRQMMEQIKKYQAIIDKANSIANHPALMQIKQIQATAESIGKVKNLTNIADYINSYNKAREFINNPNNYAENKDEFENFKENNPVETMPDIEETLLSSSEIQKEEFKAIMYEIVEEAIERKYRENTKNEKGDKILSRISASIGIFVGSPEIPEALQKYREALIGIYSIFFG
ncbi:hypothetical protein [Virgibacillus salexigens]|uniref:hypothetical protein n=1 Tax=Virgibacillus salexigens TaxID=61016 RepID=UPI001909C017|nr:hypothetical protein [Virgibacillus salexigens]